MAQSRLQKEKDLLLHRKPAFDCKPFKLATALAISEFARLAGDRYRDNASPIIGAAPSSPGFDAVLPSEEIRAVFLLLLDIVHVRNESLSFLMERMSDAPAFKDCYQTRVKTLAEGDIDKLCDFFHDVIHFAPFDPTPLLKRTSILGRFIRSVAVWYEQSTFTEVCRLASQFKDWVADDGTALPVAKKPKNIQPSVLSTSDLELLSSDSKYEEVLGSIHDLSRGIESKCYEDAARLIREMYSMSAGGVFDGHRSQQAGALSMARLSRIFGFRDVVENSLSAAVALSHQASDTTKLQNMLFDLSFVEDTDERQYEAQFRRTFGLVDENSQQLFLLLRAKRMLQRDADREGAQECMEEAKSGAEASPSVRAAILALKCIMAEQQFQCDVTTVYAERMLEMPDAPTVFKDFALECIADALASRVGSL